MPGEEGISPEYSSEIFDEAEFIKSAVRVAELPEYRECNSDTYLLSNGNYECVVYPGDKYYLDKDNNYAEIDNALVRVQDSILKTKYAYTNAANDEKVYFTDGTVPSVMVEYKDSSIEFSPLDAGKASLVIGSKSAAEALSEIAYVGANSAGYSGVYKDTDLAYIVTNGAVKEYIILNSKNAPNKFSFRFTLNGMTAKQTDEGKVLFIKDGETVFELDPLFALDAAGAYTEKLTYTLQEAKDSVIVTVSLDENYAFSPERVYPIVIDPSVMITGADVTYDTYAASLAPNTNYYLQAYLRTGMDDGMGIRRTYLKFDLPGNIAASQITQAYINIEKHSGATPSVRAYRVLHSWSSSTLTWNNKPAYSTSNASGFATHTSNNWYKIIVTDTVKQWKNGTYSNYGFVLRDSTENNVNQWNVFYSSDSVSPHKPELHIVYDSGSVQDPINVIRTNSSFADTAPYRSFIKQRSNCYAYALHTYCKSGSDLLYPGHFYHAHSAVEGDYDGAYQEGGIENLESLLKNYMELDFTQLNGTSGSEWAIAQTTLAAPVPAGYRKIALVFQNRKEGFHFYFRHSDGTWSHKNGYESVTNLSIDTNVPLTDSNIDAKAQEGQYNARPVSYYRVAKSAVIDYPYNIGNTSRNTLYNPNDKAGDVITKSIAIASTTTNANMDYAGDKDWYEFNCTPGTYVLTTTVNSGGPDIDLRFHNAYGTVLTIEENTGNVNKTVVLTGSKYYISVYAKNSATGYYTLKYSRQS